MSNTFYKCRRRAIAAAVPILLLVLGVPALVQPLNVVSIASFPLGFYVCAQAVPLVLAVLVFSYAIRADRLERRFRDRQ